MLKKNFEQNLLQQKSRAPVRGTAHARKWLEWLRQTFFSNAGFLFSINWRVLQLPVTWGRFDEAAADYLQVRSLFFFTLILKSSFHTGL
jgi:hypothetical protein